MNKKFVLVKKFKKKCLGLEKNVYFLLYYVYIMLISFLG